MACSGGAPASHSASSEGETRSPGAGPLLAAGARRKSLLALHWQALKTWSEAEVTEARMEREYRGLDARLEAVP